MARGRDWDRASARSRAARQGVDDITDDRMPGGLAPPRQRVSKADQRATLAEAMQTVTRRIRCACGHSGTVVVPTAWAGRRLRCSKCGAIA